MSGVQSIERAFAVMRALALGPAGVTELADKIDLPKSTVSRILSALETERAVEQLTAGGEYQLAEGLGELAGASAPGRNLVAAARPFLMELTDLTGETSGISILQGDDVFYLEHVEGDSAVQIRDWTGETAPLHTVPSGLVMLANAPAIFIDDYLQGELVQSTPKSMVEPSLIRERLAGIRKVGYSWVFEEFHEGLNSVAAPIRSADGTIDAALHVHGPTYRFPDMSDSERFGRLVAEAAQGLSEQLAQ